MKGFSGADLLKLFTSVQNGMHALVGIDNLQSLVTEIMLSVLVELNDAN
jgi:hypothetical protein